MSISSFFLAVSGFFSAGAAGAGAGAAGAGLVCASDGAAPSATMANTTAISTATSLVIGGLLVMGERRFSVDSVYITGFQYFPRRLGTDACLERWALTGDGRR